MGTTQEIKDELKHKIKIFLFNVTGKNINTNSHNGLNAYDGLIELVYEYRSKISKDELNEILTNLAGSEFSDAQDEVFFELCNRLDGNCSPDKDIEWW